MSSASNHTASRRAFLQSAARYGGLVTLTTACAWLSRPRRGEICINNSLCAGCSVYTDCGLPAALSAKAAMPQATQKSGTAGAQPAPSNAPRPAQSAIRKGDEP
jgi:hypothetical protein